MNNHRLLIGVIGNDIHVVANKIMSRGLEEAGYEVCNLGISNTPRNFIDAAKEFLPNLILVSSLNGEAEGWVTNLREDLNKEGLEKVLMYIGGNLAVGDKDDTLTIESRFLRMGFNRAYHRPIGFSRLFIDLKADLNEGYEDGSS